MQKFNLKRLLWVIIVSFTSFLTYARTVSHATLIELTGMEIESQKIEFVGVRETYSLNYTAEDWYVDYFKYVFNNLEENQKAKVYDFETYQMMAKAFEGKIPRRFLYMLLNESLKRGVPLEFLYAISVQETINFRYFKSLVANRNKSIDYGIMGINSYNIDLNTEHGRKFLERYFFYDNEYEKFNINDQRHVAKVCTNYLKDLLDLTRWNFMNASICYNGGYGRWAAGRAVFEAIEYGRVVSDMARSVSHLHNRISKHYYTFSYYHKLAYDVLYICATNDVEHVVENENVYLGNRMFDYPELSILTIDVYTLRDEELQEVVVDMGVFLGLLDNTGSYLVLG